MASLTIGFFVVPHDHPRVRYQHESVALCEGLLELGYTCVANENYWWEPATKKHLIKVGNVHSASVHVYNVYYFQAYPDAIGKVDYSKVNILIDREDGLYGAFTHPKFQRFDLILRAQYNHHIPYHHYHSNIQPWAFGLSRRITEAVDSSRDQELMPVLGQTYRLSHSLRTLASESLNPLLGGAYPVHEWISASHEDEAPDKLRGDTLLLWQQSGHRHDPSYYQFLNRCALTYAFGGLIFPKPYLTSRLQKPLQRWHQWQYQRKRAQGKPVERHVLLDQFDSWRWWESLYSNSVPIHMDFDYWGWQLPVQPVEGEHYLGVKDWDFEGFAERLLALGEEDLARIAKAGQEWCLQHYSPPAIAARFLDHVAVLAERRGMHHLVQQTAGMTLPSNQKPY
jgi:hypothetical protein